MCVMSVTGPSMAPVLNADYNDGGAGGDRVWVEMWGVGQGRGEGLERGMVVVYRYVFD